MKLEKHEIDHLFDEIYNMDGRGLADYFNGWRASDVDLTTVATLYGEKVFLRSMMLPISPIAIFDRWSAWRQEVGYYFRPFINEQNKINFFSNTEDMKEYFIYKICRILGIIEELEQYIPMKEPALIQDDQLIFV